VEEQIRMGQMSEQEALRSPQRKLSTLAPTMPAIGLGTFGSDHVSARSSCRGGEGRGGGRLPAFRLRFGLRQRGRDRRSFEEILRGGIKREELWITSKLWNDKHGRDDVIASCRKSLADLRLEYLDLYLVHWPFPNFHPPGCDVSSRSPDAKPYIHENYMKTWRKMEELVDLGLVRHIGTSNMTIPKLKLVLRDARIKPAVNEMELHPHFQQPELVPICAETTACSHRLLPHRLAGTAGTRPHTRGHRAHRRSGDYWKIAAATELIRRWCASSGRCSAGKRRFPSPSINYRANLAAALRGDPLTDEEMRAIAAIDRNCRLIKGQVFLWKDGQTWEDLWDMNGRSRRRSCFAWGTSSLLDQRDSYRRTD
jgi:alcohol dehydrogenase (NADP+)